MRWVGDNDVCGFNHGDVPVEFVGKDVLDFCDPFLDTESGDHGVGPPLRLFRHEDPQRPGVDLLPEFWWLIVSGVVVVIDDRRFWLHSIDVVGEWSHWRVSINFPELLIRHNSRFLL